MHRSNEDTPGHMNTGIEWPVYAYVGQQGEGEALKAMVREYLESGYVSDAGGLECANCDYWPRKDEQHKPDCLYNRLRVAVGLEAE